MSEEELLNGWIPYRMFIDNAGALKFRWIFAGTIRFTAPFFDESIATCLSLPQNNGTPFPVTTAETVLNLAQKADAVLPAGFIYHISRCGSTLLSQMLACDSQNIVLSEVPLLDDVLRLRFRKDVKPYPAIKELFGAILKLIGRKRNDERRLFIKTDSWHVLFYDDLQRWYPSVPSFLVFRSPKEVASSHALTPAMHAVPGLIEPELFGFDPAAVLEMNREHYLEQVLCSYLKKYISILHSGNPAAALNYEEGPWAMMEQIFLSCNYTSPATVSEEMKKRMAFHSKNPGNNFAGDQRTIRNNHNFEYAEQLYSTLRQLAAGIKQETHGS